MKKAKSYMALLKSGRFHIAFEIAEQFGWGAKVYAQNRLEPSSGILHYLTWGSTLSSQDYNPSSVVYVPEPIRSI